MFISLLNGVLSLKNKVSEVFSKNYIPAKNFISPVSHADPLHLEYEMVDDPRQELTEVTLTEEIIRGAVEQREESLKKPIPLLSKFFQLISNFTNNVTYTKKNNFISVNEAELSDKSAEYKSIEERKLEEHIDEFDQHLDKITDEQYKKIEKIPGTKHLENVLRRRNIVNEESKAI